MADKMDDDLKAAVDKATGMVSLKRSKKAKKEEMAVPEYDGSEYPYGLCLRLDDETLGKLDMDLPKVGSKVSIEALGEVVEVSQHEDGNDKRRHVEIQIQKMQVS